tara:strand:+ start:1622 stop:2203 length:582 start_codon:yes stop_codon:yes gene_type:complete
MFGKSFEPLSQSERIKNKRNKAIFKSVQSSNDINLDKNGNIKNVKSYESFQNTVNGFYECKKENAALNQDCFNVFLDGNDDKFSVATFEDIKSNYVNFQEYDDDNSNESNGRKFVRANDDGTNTFLDASVLDPRTSQITSGINTAANITYPFNKQGLCSNYVIQDISFFDPSGNNSSTMAKDIKKYFPLTKIT